MQNNMDNEVYAGFFVRLAAYLIDSVIVGTVLAVVIRFPVWISTMFSPDNILVRSVIFDYSIKDMMIYVLSALYFILLTYKTGMTIGKKMLHIKVVSAEDRPMTLVEVIYRETIGRFLSGLIVYGGYFMIGLHKEKRGLHDLMADTKVIYSHKKLVEVETPVEYQEIAQAYAPSSYMPVAQSEEINVSEETVFTENKKVIEGKMEETEGMKE